MVALVATELLGSLLGQVREVVIMGKRDMKRDRPPTVRSDEWPAWFSFWFSGCWRALAKGTVWAGFYCAILLLLL